LDCGYADRIEATFGEQQPGMQGTPHPTFPVSVIAIILFQVAALFARSMLDLSLGARGMDPAVANDLSYLIVPPILLVLMFPYLRMCKNSLRELFAPSRLTARVVVLSIMLGLVLRLTYWASLTLLIGTGLITNDDPNAITGPILGFKCPTLLVLLLSLGVMSCLIPLIEEVINRGYILHALLQKGTVVAIVVSATAFAAMHEPGTYIVAFLIGLILAIQTLNYRALWGPIVTHATFNALAIIDWDCFRIVWNPPANDPVFTNVVWASLPITIAGVIVSLLLVNKKAVGVLFVPRPQ
jgi:membrane protease YdiL (CAAX protease family)